MNAHAELFPQIPAIVNLLPNPIDQMKLLTALFPVRLGPRSIQAISQTIKIADPTIMRYLRNNGIFAFGQVDRAKKLHRPRESQRDVGLQ
jgi:hypothetical protein